MKKTGAIIVVMVLAVAGILLLFLTKPSDDFSQNSSHQDNTSQNTQSESNDSTQNQQESADTEQVSFTTEQVAKHNTKEDCWTIINGDVYNLTSFIAQHPGGDNILSACGINATSYFNGEQAGAAGGTNDHNSDSQALNQLARLKIGTLTK